jgi:hypothetical protein
MVIMSSCRVLLVECMRVTFILLKPSHNIVVATSDVNRMCVDEEDDFHLVGAQSCV